ncbi:2-C-methyl-D-erythritol 2,4-cyclodiphosphate synthase [Natranaerobius trueperi]|uniref:2-C-methyl-D-erythritol 2,4-cyclodiphosphate synthase n=1 Tax=Natranaerobius trueperi TaxID=759412 RepID=A0A226C0E2_9FIRM|nr:2-C-methyl-D-erythritol 2,4-cyclodiphosphate synthase [Natranaerobius trueperi]OWZ84512.1 2-C-methyl-D-erythritol 2,4-cyclodiphosphate synthase [Natranaerobius trueperi]
MRIGQGIDVHKLSSEDKLVLGGIEIPSEYGLVGHSDADVLIHSIMDALFGSLALGDIGKHFPDTDEQYRGIDSKVLLKRCYEQIKSHGYTLVNLDSTIMAERPKLAPYIPQIRKEISEVIDVKVEKISVKATTFEGLGFVGKKEGIMAQTIVLLQKE